MNFDPVKSSACSIDPNEFAEFLDDIFHSPMDPPQNLGLGISEIIPSFTLDELNKTLTTLANLRCADDDGILSTKRLSLLWATWRPFASERQPRTQQRPHYSMRHPKNQERRLSNFDITPAPFPTPRLTT